MLAKISLSHLKGWLEQRKDNMPLGQAFLHHHYPTVHDPSLNSAIDDDAAMSHILKEYVCDESAA